MWIAEKKQHSHLCRSQQRRRNCRRWSGMDYLASSRVDGAEAVAEDLLRGEGGDVEDGEEEFHAGLGCVSTL